MSKRSKSSGVLLAFLVIGVVMVSLVIVGLQFIGLALVPAAVYWVLMSVAGLAFGGALVIFPWDTKIVLAVVVGALVAVAYPMRTKVAEMRAKRQMQESRVKP